MEEYALALPVEESPTATAPQPQKEAASMRKQIYQPKDR